MLELYHWEDFEEEIKINKDIDNVSIVFSIYKDGKLEYKKELEREDWEFCIEIDKEDVDMFTPWKYTGELKVKINWKTKKKEFDVSVNAD